MAQKFNLKDLKKLYGARQSIAAGSEKTTEEFITGRDILERLQKLSYLKGLRFGSLFL
jgi:hypothetical protein